MKKIVLTFCACVLAVLALTPLARDVRPRFDSVVRFHVRANSDSRSDQSAKLAVRDAVVAYAGAVTKGCQTAREAADALAARFGAIEDLARHALRENGKYYGAKAYLAEETFPERAYGDVVFPRGDYTAVRVDLGAARGQNFWCVLFPPLCLSDACTKDVLAENGVTDFDGGYVVKFKIWESLKRFFGRFAR